MTSVTENVGIVPPGKKSAAPPTAVAVAVVDSGLGDMSRGRNSSSKSASQSPGRRSERASDDKGLFAHPKRQQNSSSPLSPKNASSPVLQQSGKSRNNDGVSENGKKNPFLTVPVLERRGRRHRHRHRLHHRRHNSVEHRPSQEDASATEKYTSTLTLILGNNRNPVGENYERTSHRTETTQNSPLKYPPFEGKCFEMCSKSVHPGVHFYERWMHSLIRFLCPLTAPLILFAISLGG